MRDYAFIGAKLMAPYMEYCKTIGIWSEHKATCLSSLDAYCSRNWPNANELSQEMVDGWCSKRPTEQINTCIARSKPIRHFLKYQREHGLLILGDPERPSIRLSSYIPHPFSEEELKRFFYLCDCVEFSSNNKRNCRNLQLTIPVFFRLLYSSGMRPIEARQLSRGDVDMNTGVVNIRKSKGGNQHYIVLHDSMRELMNRYDEAISGLYPDREYFFPDHMGRSVHPNYWVERHFKKLWIQVSGAEAVPYAFRHHYAVTNINQWIGEGFDFFDKLVYLSKSMGHCAIESTKGYYSLVPAISSILKEKTEIDFNEIIPEVSYEESDE